MRNPRIAFRVGGAADAVGVGDATPPVRRIAIGCLLAGLVASASGCEKKDDSSRPAAIAANPSAAVPAVTVPPTSPTSPAAVPPAPAAPPAAPSAASANGGKGGGTILGKITLATARKADVTPTDVVYLVARRVSDSPGTRGALVAVKRYTASSFPIEFTLGPGDMMFQNGAFEGDLTLSVRVDKDGDPMTRRKGDVFGTADRVHVGASGVEIKLDQLQKEDESLAGPAAVPGGMPAGHP